MKALTVRIATINALFLLFPLITHAAMSKNAQHTIHLTEIHPLGFAPHTFISDKFGNTIIADNNYDGYQRSLDKGQTWTAEKTGSMFIPQEISPTNNTDTLAMSVQRHGGMLEVSVDTGSNWSQITSSMSNCPFLNIDQRGRIGVLTPAKVRFFPNHPNTLLFVAPTGEDNKSAIFYSNDGGYSCKNVLESARGLDLSVADDGGIMFATDRKFSKLYYSTNALYWRSRDINGIESDHSSIVQAQTQIHNIPEGTLGVDFVAAVHPKSNVVSLRKVTINPDNLVDIFPADTNFKGIRYLSSITDNQREKLFAIDGNNHFMLNQGITEDVLKVFTPLTVVFDQDSSKQDLSNNWRFLSLTWINPEHTQGIVNFINYATGNRQITYRFSID